ncbi:MAG: bifunctional phosphopantothenoylcysteine decarboxylase/phosphopantothenate--cysteine ligase CoaBC, partial [Gammaproteobacteria bacterium]
AYKSVELLRSLVTEGADVWTVMTPSATEFVGPLTFQVLSGHPVRTDLFAAAQEGEIQHIALADMAELAVIAPATANVIAKMAHGLADDLLTTILLAVRCPVVVCPAMNVNMFDHPAVQDNLRSLRARGVHVVDPQEGRLACGWEGKGRLPPVELLLEHLKRALSPQDLTGEHLLITAGPTREPFDPVRFVSNPSTGRMGFALARAARRRGADVTLICGPTHLTPPEDVRVVSVGTAKEMYEAVMLYLPEATVVIKAAAVSDYRPTRSEQNKIKKREDVLSVQLERTPDILAEVGRQKGGRLLIGFAAETRDLLAHAREKLRGKNLDWIVANDLSNPDAGFGVDTNQVTILYRDGGSEELPKMSKEDLAAALMDRLVRERRGGRRGGQE